MRGHEITYTQKERKETINFQHMLYGRADYRSYKGRRYSYYIPGMLDKKQFVKMHKATIFVKDLEGLELDKLRKYVNLTVEEVDKNVTEEDFETGQEVWEKRSENKGLVMRRQRRKKHRCADE